MAEKRTSPLFAKPNLKLFVIGALALMVVNDIFTGARIQASARSVPNYDHHALPLTDEEVLRLVQYAIQHPSHTALVKVSEAYQIRGDYRRALIYIQRAADYEDED